MIVLSNALKDIDAVECGRAVQIVGRKWEIIGI